MKVRAYFRDHLFLYTRTPWRPDAHAHVPDGLTEAAHVRCFACANNDEDSTELSVGRIQNCSVIPSPVWTTAWQAQQAFGLAVAEAFVAGNDREVLEEEGGKRALIWGMFAPDESTLVYITLRQEGSDEIVEAYTIDGLTPGEQTW